MSSSVNAPPAASEPLLRTLAPALRQLERSLRVWLDVPHQYPLPTMRRAALEGLANDLRRQADALDVDRPLLVIMLMGGTGVGKSTLLNALAGGAVAQASFARPTTRDPVVYYHESVRPERLDPALQQCRLVQHDRPALEHKILVDTPDLDSNDLSNRDKLLRLLPVADVVLYVGSQEKYHDRLGWELFLQQRKRRAFAFVLNKWDRCLHAATSGLRPDEDLLQDLRDEGFQEPLLFRTNAQRWVDEAAGRADGAPPEGEQFRDLVGWLEMGLTRLEIEAIKARGVMQLLRHLEQALEAVRPPDLTGPAARTQAEWKRTVDEEARATADVLLNTLEPYQREIEHHFALQGQQRFHGMMAGYLYLFTRVRYVGSTLRDRVSLWPRAGKPSEPAPSWDLATFTRACSETAASRHLDARGKALANRLLVEADGQDFPVNLLTPAVEAAARLDWRQRYAIALSEVLQQVEQQWSRPGGARRWLHTLVIWVADWLPPVVLLAALVNLLLHYFDPWGRGYQVGWIDLFLPLFVVLAVLVILHVLITVLLPLRWTAIRGEFQRRLEARLTEEMEEVFDPLPGRVAEALQAERKQVEQLLGETAEVAGWLEQREQAASVAGLYGR
jgi:energy-coupling factor transporter ATP-binding protein EcfA2